MKILYGVQGTGNGHITRARHMAKALAKRTDVKVDYFFSGRSPTKYFDMCPFGDFQTGRGLTFITENGRIDYCKTVSQNNVFNLAHEIKRKMVTDYDLIINDFEPITAWAAKAAGVPSLSISHQAAFLHRVPRHKQGILDKFVTHYFAPTKFSLGTHWYHFGYNIIPPFVADELLRGSNNSNIDDNILVYLPFEKLTAIKSQLQCLSDYRFTCFHPDISEAVKDKNILWRPLSITKFKDSLRQCSGVMSNCGFELSTECLALGKPLIVKPLSRQYEQLSNAYTLKALGASEVLENIHAETIDEWLQERKSVKIEFASNCDLFVDWVLDGKWAEPDAMRKKLWEQVKFPSQVKQKLLNFSY